MYLCVTDLIRTNIIPHWDKMDAGSQRFKWLGGVVRNGVAFNNMKLKMENETMSDDGWRLP